MKLPIFKEQRRTYAADTCEGVLRGVEAGQVRLCALARGQYPGEKLPKSALPGVKTIGYWDAQSPQCWGLDWHRNEGVEFTFLENGHLAFAVDGQAAALAPGSLTITRPWQLHRVGDPHVGAGRLYWLILDVGVRRPHQAWKWPSWLVLAADDRKRLTEILRHNEEPVWQATDHVGKCFKRIGAVTSEGLGETRLSELTLAINELLLAVLKMFGQRKVALNTALASSARTVELFLSDLTAAPEHLAREWTLKEMARQCGLGVTHFVHHCRRQTGMPPLKFLCQRRLELARELLLAEPNRTVTDIALECGFSSSQYFATVFGRRFGCTPRAFRDL